MCPSMAPNKDDFSISGPAHLIPPPLNWWNNPDHKRSIVACLVQGTYVLEKERRENIEGTRATLAPPWWESFGFLLYRVISDHKGSYIGAIYQYRTSSPSQSLSPSYVVAFRGTILDSRDMLHNIRLIRDKLQRTSRSSMAIQAFLSFFNEIGNSTVWLAGHSLGSAMAMHVGKHMARNKGVYLDCFLFNPPFISPPIGLLENKYLKHVIRVGHSVGVVGLSLASKNSLTNLDMGLFLKLSSWRPHLFVHDNDSICLGYIGYFSHRKVMEDIGLGCIESVAARNSIIGLLRKKIDGVQNAEEPLHLIPSANLTVNRSPADCLRDAHTLNQWWGPHLQLESIAYGMDSNQGFITD